MAIMSRFLEFANSRAIPPVMRSVEMYAELGELALAAGLANASIVPLVQQAVRFHACNLVHHAISFGHSATVGEIDHELYWRWSHQRACNYACHQILNIIITAQT